MPHVFKITISYYPRQQITGQLAEETSAVHVKDGAEGGNKVKAMITAFCRW
jgi:hypothetical protein